MRTNPPLIPLPQSPLSPSESKHSFYFLLYTRTVSNINTQVVNVSLSPVNFDPLASGLWALGRFGHGHHPPAADVKLSVTVQVVLLAFNSTF